ncbi:hypothetical protein KFE98_05900 [bacterium SCSIO 12741]|nr:hypothetical protein KFE98_05900 [bacterium SCSIO 12741]
MLKYLIGCLLLSALLTGCRYQPLPKYADDYGRQEGRSAADWVDQPGLYRFDASFDRKESHFTGVFYFKSIDSNQVKIAMTTDMGYKLFDLLLTREGVQWNYIYPDMDKAILKGILEKEFRTLLMYIPYDCETWVYEQKPLHERIHWEKEKIYFYPDSNRTGTYEKIQLVRRNKVRVEVQASNFRPLEKESKGNAPSGVPTIYIPDHMVLKDYLAQTTITLKRKL